MLIVGGSLADSAIDAMRNWDVAEMRAREAEAQSRRKKH